MPSNAHQMRDFVNRIKDPAVQELVRRVRHAYAQRGVTATSKTALTRTTLEAMFATPRANVR